MRNRTDGMMVHDMSLYQVKTPAEPKSGWDICRKIATVPGDKANLQLSEPRVRC